MVVFVWLWSLSFSFFFHDSQFTFSISSSSSSKLPVANEFASMAFRFGHSQVTDILRRLDETLKPGKHGHLHLRDNYFSPGKKF